jgi:hypothetical protein
VAAPAEVVGIPWAHCPPTIHTVMVANIETMTPTNLMTRRFLQHLDFFKKKFNHFLLFKDKLYMRL